MHPTVRFAYQVDAMQLAELRWLSRSVKEQELEDIDAFTLRFSTWFASALTSKSWHVAVSEEQRSMLSGCMFLRKVETVPVPGLKSRAWGYVTHAFVREPSRNQGTALAYSPCSSAGRVSFGFMSFMSGQAIVRSHFMCARASIHPRSSVQARSPMSRPMFCRSPSGST